MNDQHQINVAAFKKALIDATSAGGKWTRRGLSIAAGLGPDAVRDILSGKSKAPSFGTVTRLSEQIDVPVSRFISVEASPSSVTVKVIGTVEAGVWREANPGYDLPWPGEIVSAPLPNLPHAKRFGLRVVGYSMDQVFQPGSILDCIDIFSSRMSPQSGDYVIVERVQGDLRETTVKEYNIDGDGILTLLARSTRPEFEAPIVIGKPNREQYDDNEIRVIALVVGNYTPVLPRFR